MSWLSDRIANAFTSSARRRGEDYLDGGRIFIPTWTTDRIVADVRGSSGDDYRILIERAGSEIILACDCPYYLDRGPCKHIWGTVLLAEEDPRFDDWLPRAGFKVKFDLPDIGDTLFTDDELGLVVDGAVARSEIGRAQHKSPLGVERGSALLHAHGRQTLHQRPLGSPNRLRRPMTRR